MPKNPAEMTPEELVKWFADELNRGQSIVIPVVLLKDTVTGLGAWQGIKEDDLDVRTAEINKGAVKSKHKHCTLTLKKHVKAK